MAAPTAGGFPAANIHLEQGEIDPHSFENEPFSVTGEFVEVGQGKEKGTGKGTKGPLSAQQLVFRNLSGKLARTHNDSGKHIWSLITKSGYIG